MVNALAGGAIGEPGGRTFYLQVDLEEQRLWFLLEKQQLAAIAEAVLEALRGTELDEWVEPPAVVEPTEPAPRVGEIAIGLGDGVFSLALYPLEPDESEAVRFEVPADVAAGMARAALAAVAAGRSPCPFCRLPMDPEGHVCPATNGNRGERLES